MLQTECPCSLKTHRLKPNLWWYMEVGSLRSDGVMRLEPLGMNAFITEIPKSPPRPFCQVRTQREDSCLQTRKLISPDTEFHWHPEAGLSRLQNHEKHLSVVVYKLPSLWYSVKTGHMRNTYQFSCGWSSYLECGIYFWHVFSDSCRPRWSIALLISEPEGADFDHLMAGRRTHSGVCKQSEPRNKPRGRGWHACLLYVPNSPIRLNYSMPGEEGVLCQGNTLHREGNNRLRGVK